MPARTLRGRLTRVLASTLGATVLVAGVAMVTSQSRQLQNQLDASLRAHARSEIETAIDRVDHRAHLHDAPIDVSSGADETVALTKYAALYGDHGAPLASTRPFRGRPPVWRSAWVNTCFDLEGPHETLRAVVLPMGRETDARALLLAVPRSPLDAATRSQALLALGLLAVAVALATGLAAALARWLTRDLEAIARTAREVARGDLDARVGKVGGVAEVRSLAADLDNMIARLAELVATKRRFVSDAAHELRAPLTSLRGELELALRRPRTVDEYRAALTRAHDDVLALGALADDLLALARKRTDASEARASVAEAARRVTELLRERAAQHDVKLRDEVGDLHVRCAPRDLERVVRNLVENAIRHAPAGTAVSLSADAHGETVTVAVRDDGSGVPIEQAERIFEPFVRLDAARTRDAGGSGLGLAIAREICRANEGDVSLDVHHEGPGARFVVTLKRA
ncbi:MAG: HAMP domain-containing sensor histidine kinase [Polyangiales bacterium]